MALKLRLMFQASLSVFLLKIYIIRSSPLMAEAYNQKMQHLTSYRFQISKKQHGSQEVFMNQLNWELLPEKLLLHCPVMIWMPLVRFDQVWAGLALNLAKSQTACSTFNIQSRSSVLLFHICITDKIPISNKSQNVKQICTGNTHSCRYSILVLKGYSVVFVKDSRKKVV